MHSCILSALPAHFWDTSQIFLANDQGHIVDPLTLDSTQEFYLAAMIGNSGGGAGRLFMGLPPVQVICNAYSFNSFLSRHTAALAGQSRSGRSNPVYETFGVRGTTYDVAGFRFNVDAVASGLEQALNKGVMDMTINLGGATAKEWLNAGHACVKLLLTAGEVGSPYAPFGGAPLTDASDPHKDRHIVQKNLAPLNITGMGAMMIRWTNFIVAQAGAGANALALQHGLPADAFRLYVAVPTRPYQRYIAKGGSHRDFEQVREAPHKPFPDAVILRQTDPEASLHIADHARERFFGMSLGVEWDPARVKGVRLGDVAMAHAGHDGRVVGGFTLRLRKAR